MSSYPIDSELGNPTKVETKGIKETKLEFIGKTETH